MKYIIDNQLPPALARHLEQQGLECHHVAETGLDEASDRDIWRHAAAHGYAVISKDEDFLYLANTDPSGRPWTLELRAGQEALSLVRFCSMPPILKAEPPAGIRADALVSELISERALKFAGKHGIRPGFLFFSVLKQTAVAPSSICSMSWLAGEARARNYGSIGRRDHSSW